MENTETSRSEATNALLNEAKLFQYREKLKLEQNLALGFAGGAAAALVGALLWAIITVATGYQIGYMAVGVGFLVGYSVRYLGKGIDQIFGILGATLALAGCLIGNFFSIIGFAAEAENLGYLETLLSIDYNLVPEIMMEAFSPIDLLFYGFAVYEGYRFSFRQFTEEEMISNSEIVR